MYRIDFKHTAAALLFAGLLLRALTPVGYMPGTMGGEFLFELCPEQLPPGIIAPDTGSATHQHHHNNSGETPSETEADNCQVGHLLFSAIAADQTDSTPIVNLTSSSYSPLLVEYSPYARVFSYQSRAPPA